MTGASKSIPAHTPRATKLKPRQKFFCLEYLKDFNATQAAIRAGYSPKAAQEVSSRMLSSAMISEEIRAQLAARTARLAVEADDVLRELLLVAKSDIAAAFTPEGGLKSIHEIPAEFRRAISGIESLDEYEGQGENRRFVGTVRKIKLWEKTRALELLGRHLRLFDDSLPQDRAVSISITVDSQSQPDAPERARETVTINLGESE